MEKTVFVIFAYRNRELLAALVRYLDHEHVHILIHFDRTGHLAPECPPVRHATVALTPHRRAIKWGGSGVARVQWDVVHSVGPVAHLAFLTEDTIPLHPFSELMHRLQSTFKGRSLLESWPADWPGLSLVNVLPKNIHRTPRGLLVKFDYALMGATRWVGRRFGPAHYRGRAWCCLSGEHVSQLAQHRFFLSRFQRQVFLWSFLCEEYFLPTVVTRTLSEGTVSQRMVFAEYEYTQENPNPGSLTWESWEQAATGDFLFARKASESLWELVSKKGGLE